jgi:hypothetical protein
MEYMVVFLINLVTGIIVPREFGNFASTYEINA